MLFILSQKLFSFARYSKLCLPKSLTDSLPYSQADRPKRISSNQVDLNNSLMEMKNNFVKQGYHLLLINEHLERIRLLN